MLQQHDLWRAIDCLASKYGLSPSGLARKAGLDPTALNKSKRTYEDGRLCWPSTETLAKILDAAGAPLEEFVDLIGDSPGESHAKLIPVVVMGQAPQEGRFDSTGMPVGDDWDMVSFPRVSRTHAYALVVTGDAMAPIYNDGTILVVSTKASSRSGDRVVAKLYSGEILVMRLMYRSATKIELVPLFGDGGKRTIDLAELAWVSRILWASQ